MPLTDTAIRGIKAADKPQMERIDKNIFPFLGNRPIAEISPSELLAVLRKIELRGAVDQAHRVRSICSLIFRYAIAQAERNRTLLLICVGHSKRVWSRHELPSLTQKP